MGPTNQGHFVESSKVAAATKLDNETVAETLLKLKHSPLCINIIASLDKAE